MPPDDNTPYFRKALQLYDRKSSCRYYCFVMRGKCRVLSTSEHNEINYPDKFNIFWRNSACNGQSELINMTGTFYGIVALELCAAAYSLVIQLICVRANVFLALHSWLGGCRPDGNSSRRLHLRQSSKMVVGRCSWL